MYIIDNFTNFHLFYNNKWINGVILCLLVKAVLYNNYSYTIILNFFNTSLH